MATDLFRQGKRDVHHATASADPDDPNRPTSCNIDLLPGPWLPGPPPPGSRCPRCFFGYGDEQRARRRQAQNSAAAGTAAVALVAAVLLGQGSVPVNVLSNASYGPTLSTASVAASTRPTFTAAPSATAGIPSQTPAPTESLVPQATTIPTPQIVIARQTIVIYTPAQPDSRFRPQPLPGPAPTCYHPGLNLGHDECKWPHN